jgi:glyoxylase-like metal-dependent hydrolase (beta-lactamase superfamily II)
MSVRRLDRPVLDFGSGHTDTLSADKVIAHVRDQGLQVEWILETHAHADHLWAAHYLQQKVGGRIAIGEHIRQVQATFKKLYNLERDFLPDGSQFDHRTGVVSLTMSRADAARSTVACSKRAGRPA